MPNNGLPTYDELYGPPDNNDNALPQKLDSDLRKKHNIETESIPWNSKTNEPSNVTYISGVGHVENEKTQEANIVNLNSQKEYNTNYLPGSSKPVSQEHDNIYQAGNPPQNHFLSEQELRKLQKHMKCNTGAGEGGYLAGSGKVSWVGKTTQDRSRNQTRFK